MKSIVTVFALLTAIAGWFYLFYSQAARKLEALEKNANNQKRIRLRQVNGFAMLLLAILFFAGFHTVDPESSPGAYIAVWIGVMIVLLVIVVLAMIDVRLTMQLRRDVRGFGVKQQQSREKTL